jgi:hypothetical protein
MLWLCVLIADWLTPELVGEWCVRAGERARGTRGRGSARSCLEIRFPL